MREAGGESVRCPFCHESFRAVEAVWRCPRCGTAQHYKCALEGQRCTVLGCGATAAREDLPVFLLTPRADPDATPIDRRIQAFKMKVARAVLGAIERFVARASELSRARRRRRPPRSDV